jgi:hypothetical protein
MPVQPGEIALMENENPALGAGEFYIVEVTELAIYGMAAFPCKEIFIRQFRADLGWRVARHGIELTKTTRLLDRLSNASPTADMDADMVGYLIHRINESVRQNDQWKPYLKQTTDEPKLGIVGDTICGEHNCEKGEVRRFPIPPGRKYLDVKIEDDGEDGENFVFALR